MIRSLPKFGGFLSLAMLLTGISGCGVGSGGSPSDPTRGSAALHAALDAWKGGKTLSSLESLSPPVHVSDTDWNSGLRLASYREAGEARHVGSDLNYPVTLELKDKRGISVKKNVVYVVTTDPRLLVLRND